MNMKKTLIVLITAVLIVAVLIGVAIITINTYNSSMKNNTPSKPIGINPSAIKTNAIDFKLKDLDGKELSLSDLKGKKVFLNFWATWCPPCKAEMPEIEKLYEETKDSDLVIVAVEIGEPLSTVKSFIDSNKYSFKVLLDSDQSVASKYNIASIPTSYFIDVDGNVISKNVGGMNIDQMKASIKALDK
jgi:peroxiredoxin